MNNWDALADFVVILDAKILADEIAHDPNGDLHGLMVARHEAVDMLKRAKRRDDTGVTNIHVQATGGFGTDTLLDGLYDKGQLGEGIVAGIQAVRDAWGQPDVDVIEVVVVKDWVSPDTIAEVKERAAQAEAAFQQTGGGAYEILVDGAGWPDIGDE